MQVAICNLLSQAALERLFMTKHVEMIRYQIQQPPPQQPTTARDSSLKDRIPAARHKAYRQGVKS
jgi:hypothetical protein